MLISFSKHTRKYLQVTPFVHSAFVTSQSLFVPMSMVLKRHLACWTFSKCQSYSNESCSSICTYCSLVNLMLTSAAQLCLWSALYQDGGVANTVITCEFTVEKDNW